MAKHSFDLPLLHGEGERTAPTAVVLKLILPDDPSGIFEGIDPTEEITSLGDSAGMEIVAVVSQRRRRPHAATYVGKGKLEELNETLARHDAKLILVDDPLSPRQARKIEALTATGSVIEVPAPVCIKFMPVGG